MGILAYSFRGKTLLRKKSLMSVVMKRASSVEMTLLNGSFEVTTSLALVVTLPGQLTSLPPTAILCSSGFRFARSIGNNDAWVCGFAVGWHFVPVDEATSVGSFDFFVALEESADFVAE